MEYFHSSEQFNQPNDMTIASDGTIYASDPHWKRRDGQVWRISRSADGKVSGEKMASPRPMSTTNGIDFSPDERTLFVGEFELSRNLGISNRWLEILCHQGLSKTFLTMTSTASGPISTVVCMSPAC